MKKYTAYIVDDEPLAISTLKKKVRSYSEVEVIGESTSLQDAVFEINNCQPDILFLDNQLTLGDSGDLFFSIMNFYQVIFVSTFEEFVRSAFEVKSIDFLLKPVNQKRLNFAVIKTRLKSDESDSVSLTDNGSYNYADKVLVLEKNTMRFISLDSIVLITASRDYSTIETIEGKRNLIMRSMNEWEKRLPSEHFIRIHRSYIVNINHIEKIVRNSTSSANIFIKNLQQPVTLSRSYYKSLKTRFE